MSSLEHKIRVDVETSYLDEQSDPRESRYVFAYTITIRNEGQVPARLFTRHWVITDANGKVEEVRGDGVVGEQPYLKPGQGFRYSSGAVLETPVGSMQGSYQMLADNGAHFEAPIQPLRIACGCCSACIWSTAARTRWRCCGGCAHSATTRWWCWETTICICWRSRTAPTAAAGPTPWMRYWRRPTATRCWNGSSRARWRTPRARISWCTRVSCRNGRSPSH